MPDSAPFGFAILASGVGTNARSLLEHARKNPKALQAKILISDRAGVPALKVAEEFGIPHRVVDAREEKDLIRVLQEYGPSWAFLAGYKKIVGKAFLDFFWDEDLGFSRVLNVHPSLLPAYPGLHGYERAYQDGVKISGVTVHLVDSGLDTGKILFQEAFQREEEDSLEQFIARARSIEHRLFPMALEYAAAGKIHLVKTATSQFLSTK